MTFWRTALLLALAVAAVPAPAAAAAPEEAPRVAPSRLHGATAARIIAPVFARERLRSARNGRRMGVQTVWSGQPQELLVLDQAVRDGRQWVKVLLPHRPNGSAGWIPRDRVVLEHRRYWIDVRVSTRRVTVYRDGRRVRSFLSVVGAPATPTPLGFAATYERNRQPNPRGPLGPWVLALTAHSNVLFNFNGGDGRAAIHGVGTLSDPLGTARSNGCVRVTHRQLRWLARRIENGTPVLVRR
jgi:lipoprotein-anchoring transpeptidase ErfK/SrfK